MVKDIVFDLNPTGGMLWEQGIKELTGHNLETQGREEVNQLLKKGWLLLHIYTLRYQDDGTWRERPMAILGKPAKQKKSNEKPKAHLAAM